MVPSLHLGGLSVSVGLIGSLGIHHQLGMKGRTLLLHQSCDISRRVGEGRKYRTGFRFMPSSQRKQTFCIQRLFIQSFGGRLWSRFSAVCFKNRCKAAPVGERPAAPEAHTGKVVTSPPNQPQEYLAAYAPQESSSSETTCIPAS